MEYFDALKILIRISNIKPESFKNSPPSKSQIGIMVGMAEDNEWDTDYVRKIALIVLGGPKNSVFETSPWLTNFQQPLPQQG